MTGRYGPNQSLVAQERRNPNKQQELPCWQLFSCSYSIQPLWLILPKPHTPSVLLLLQKSQNIIKNTTGVSFNRIIGVLCLVNKLLLSAHILPP